MTPDTPVDEPVAPQTTGTSDTAADSESSDQSPSSASLHRMAERLYPLVSERLRRDLQREADRYGRRLGDR